MVMTDDDLLASRLPSNYASYGAYYVPKPKAAAARNANKIIPRIMTQTRPCAHPRACAAHTARTACAQTRGCQWDTTATPASCVPADCTCTVVAAPALSKCARVRAGFMCDGTSGCYWDAELGRCFPKVNLWNLALGLAALVPVVYGICYYVFNRTHATALWASYGPTLRIAYRCSVAVATAAFAFILLSVTLTRKHIDNRWRMAGALFLLVAGAVATPVMRAMWLHADWTVYGVLAGLLLTSAGAMWLIGVYIHRAHAAPDAVHDRSQTALPSHPTDRRALFPSARNTFNLLGMLSAYYALFHVVVVDNLGWWWLVEGSVTGEGA